jgi:hypothetical protein
MYFEAIGFETDIYYKSFQAFLCTRTYAVYTDKNAVQVFLFFRLKTKIAGVICE